MRQRRAPAHDRLPGPRERRQGWLRYYRFDPAAATLTATTYSPTLGQYETDDSSSFTLPFDLVGQVPAPFQTIATVTVPSGQTASTTWAGLARDTEYEWRAVVSDGTSTTESPTWRLRTPYDPVVVRDEINRTQTSGWGSTDTGQAWVLNNLNRLSVNGSAGVLAVDVGRRYEGMLDTSAGDVSVLTSIATTATATGSGTYASAVQRKSSTQLYTAKVQYSSTGAPTLTLVRQVGSTETTLASLRLGTTPAANQMLHLRFEAEGTSPVRLRARTWTGATEPTAWTLTASDATVGFQTPTVGVGISAYVSSTATAAATVLVDRLEVSRLAPPPNRAPSAGLTSSVTGLTVTADARTSTDPDGDALTYAWAFGDGATATGATTSHTLAAAGTYPMVLTVTDSRGATNQVSVPVTVAPPPNAVTPRPTEDVERDRTARAQDRQRSLEARAQRRADEARDVALRAEQAFETLPPGGEPIKVGHHSEHRHRRALERADEATRRSIEADREAEHAAQRAATARSSQAARYSPLTVANRIERLAAEIRRLERSIEKPFYDRDGVFRQPTPAEIAARTRRVGRRLTEKRDQLTYWQNVRAEQLRTGKVTAYGPSTVRPGDRVKIRGFWYQVVRANAKSVTVPNPHGWHDRTPWREVTGHRPATPAPTSKEQR